MLGSVLGISVVLATIITISVCVHHLHQHPQQQQPPEGGVGPTSDSEKHAGGPDKSPVKPVSPDIINKTKDIPSSNDISGDKLGSTTTSSPQSVQNDLTRETTSQSVTTADSEEDRSTAMTTEVFDVTTTTTATTSTSATTTTAVSEPTQG